MFKSSYAHVFDGDENWNGLKVPGGENFTWSDDSTYVKNPPYFEGMTLKTSTPRDIRRARARDARRFRHDRSHLSAGSIAVDSPAGRYLIGLGVQKKDFNARLAARQSRGDGARHVCEHSAAQPAAPGTEGGWTTHIPSGDQISIYDAAMRDQSVGTPLLILAGKEYGAGSSRDWAAKGTALLGVRAVIAESYERIHRSNLIGMGVVPLQYREGESAASLGLPHGAIRHRGACSASKKCVSRPQPRTARRPCSTRRCASTPPRSRTTSPRRYPSLRASAARAERPSGVDHDVATELAAEGSERGAARVARLALANHGGRPRIARRRLRNRLVLVT